MLECKRCGHVGLDVDVYDTGEESEYLYDTCSQTDWEVSDAEV